MIDVILMQDSINNLQRALRRLQVWNAVLLGAVAILAAVVIAGALAENHVSRAQSIQLISADGDLLAELGVRDGQPGLYLKDENGVDRVALIHSADDSGLYIMDAENTTRIGVVQFSHGGGGVALHGEDSNGAAVLYFKNEGSLRFFDSTGEVTHQVTAGGPDVDD